MCPICLSAMAWLTIGGGSAASLGGFMVARRQKDGGDGNGAPHWNA